MDDEIFTNLCTEESMNKLEQSLDLTEAFNFLDPTYKTIILLRYYHDLSIKEIAEVLNSPEGTVKSHYIERSKLYAPF